MGRFRCTIVFAAIGVAFLPGRPIATAPAVSAAEATTPAPPAPDFPLLEALAVPDTAMTGTDWEPMTGSAPVEVVELTGRTAWRMPCAFAGAEFERASWDLPVDLDMAACRGLRFQFYCADPTPVRGFNCYLQSGRGWYNVNFDPTELDAWETIAILKSDARIEGTPIGWGQIDRIRISAWRGRDADTEFYLGAFGLIDADAPIAVIRNEAGMANLRNERDAIVAVTDRLAGLLAQLELPHFILSDFDLSAERLASCRVAILPHNPMQSQRYGTMLSEFVEGGGRIVSFYKLRPELADLQGVELGDYLRPDTPGRFASIRFREDALRGAPEAVEQRSHNITQARPIEGRSRTVAEWYDAEGEPTGEPAVIVSDRGVHMTHVLTGDDRQAARRMLLAMVGQAWPGAWKHAAENQLAKIGTIGPFDNFDKARRGISNAAGDKPPEALTSAIALRTEAIARADAERYPEAIEAAQQSRDCLIEAYASVQPPRPGEYRGFWCHSAFGVEGMPWDEAIRNLAENGFTAIVPNMLWGGVAYYESDVLPVADSIAERGDQIAECLAACRKYGVACHVWKVNWNMSGRAPREFAERMEQAGRTQVRFDGGAENRWLCPSHPENQRLEIESMVEVATKYDVDGIHFDYIRYPNRDGCFCEGCRGRFEKRIGRTLSDWPEVVRTDDALDEQWLQFRRDNITTVVAAVSRRVRNEAPDVKISAAVFPNWPDARDNVAQDWKMWCERGWLDFVCPMDYTAGDAVFAGLVESQLQWAGGVPCYPGIGLSVWQPRGDACNVIGKIKIARNLGAPGFMVFNYGPLEANEVVPLLGKGITKPVGTKRQTAVSIDGDRFLINGQPTYAGLEPRARGRLMNARMVNATFDDENPDTRREGFDPDANTTRFIDAMDEYKAHGILAFTLNLQGGNPGYEGAINSAFERDGSLKGPYMRRLDRVIEAADAKGMVVILGFFYQRQDQILADEDAVRAATRNAAVWLAEKGYTNVIVEIANEYRHGGFDHRIIKSEAGQVELMNVVRAVHPGLIVTTSGMGNARFHPTLCKAADVIILHGNETEPDDYADRIAAVAKYGKPVLFNEDWCFSDDRRGIADAPAKAQAAFENGASWGIMNQKRNQHWPFVFGIGRPDEGQNAREDRAAYETIRSLVGMP